MSHKYKIGDVIKIIKTPLNDEEYNDGTRLTKKEDIGVIVKIMPKDHWDGDRFLIVFEKTQPNRHNEGASAFKKLFPKTEYKWNSSWWVNSNFFTLYKEYTQEEKQQQKEQNIIAKCKFLDIRFAKYQKLKKSKYHKLCTYKEYCYPTGSNDDD